MLRISCTNIIKKYRAIEIERDLINSTMYWWLRSERYLKYQGSRSINYRPKKEDHYTVYEILVMIITKSTINGDTKL